MTPSWFGCSGWLTAPADDEVRTCFGSQPVGVRGLENRVGVLETRRIAK